MINRSTAGRKGIPDIEPEVDFLGRTGIIPSMSPDTPAAATSVPDEVQAVPIPPRPDKATPEAAHRRRGKARHSRTPPEQRMVEVVDGVKVIRIRALAGLGQAAEQVEVRHIAHGRLLLSAHTADLAISMLDETVQKLMNQDPRDLKKILSVMRVLAAFNAQLLECGKAQIRASSEPSSGTTGTTGSDSRMPLPAGRQSIQFSQRHTDVPVC